MSPRHNGGFLLAFSPAMVYAPSFRHLTNHQLEFLWFVRPLFEMEEFGAKNHTRQTLSDGML